MGGEWNKRGEERTCLQLPATCKEQCGARKATLKSQGGTGGGHSFPCSCAYHQTAQKAHFSTGSSHSPQLPPKDTKCQGRSAKAARLILSRAYICIICTWKYLDHPISSCPSVILRELCTPGPAPRRDWQRALGTNAGVSSLPSLFDKRLWTFWLIVIKHMCSFKNRSFKPPFSTPENTYSTGDRKLGLLKREIWIWK